MKRFMLFAICIFISFGFIRPVNTYSETKESLVISKYFIADSSKNHYECHFKMADNSYAKVLFLPNPQTVSVSATGDFFKVTPKTSASLESLIIGTAVIYSNIAIDPQPIDLGNLIQPNQLSKASEYNYISLFAVSATETTQGLSLSLETKNNQQYTSEEIKKQATHQLILINKDHKIPDDYDLTALQPFEKNKGIFLQKNSLKMMPSAIDALYNMVLAAKKEGVTQFVAQSAYRSIAEQSSLYQYRYSLNVKKYGKTLKATTETQKKVALPKSSEHHTGFALDIFSKNGMHITSFGKTKESKWLITNAYKYGYIVRYQEGKTPLTSVMYEPWHIRYVGVPFAELMQSRKWCFEELHQSLNAHHLLVTTSSSDKKLYALSQTKKLPQIINHLEQPLAFKVSHTGSNSYIITLVL